MNEDILKKALEQTLDESYNELIDQDIPDYDFSPEFKAKMDGLILSQQAQPEKKRSRTLWFTAMAAAAALLAVTVGVNKASQPSRKPDKPTGIISESSVAETSISGTAGTSSADSAVTETTVSAETTNVSKKTSDKATASATTETTAVSKKQNAPSAVTASQNITKKTESSTAKTSDAGTNTVTSAPTVTSVSVSVTDITTTTGGSAKPPDERSSSMKKISAFLAALIAANPIIPTVSNADDNLKDIPVSPLLYDNPYWLIDEDMYKKFEEFRADESIFDFDEDGNFTVKDIYIYYRMTYTPDEIKPEKAFSADINGNGYMEDIYGDDLSTLIYYYSLYHTVTAEQLTPSYYLDAADGIQLDKYDCEMDNYYNGLEFTERLSYFANRIYQLYDIFCDITEEKNVDFDVDGNGKVDFGDIIDFAFFVEGNNDVLFFSRTQQYPELEIYQNFTFNSFLSKDVYERCTDVFNEFLIDGYAAFSEAIGYYAIEYYFDKYGFDPKYSTYEYLNYLRPYGVSSLIFSPIDSYQQWLGYDHGDLLYSERMKDGTYVDPNDQYVMFKQLADAGKRTVPDLNEDGLFDVADIRLAELFFDEYRFRDDITLPPEYRDNFNKYMDLNENGILGDIGDIVIYESYITDINGFDSSYLVEETYQYYIDHPEFDPEHANEFLSLSHGYEEIKTLDEYISEIKAGTNKEPDINRDGRIGIEDYVLADIIQDNKAYNCQRRMAIVPDDVKEYYLTECDFDQDGLIATYRDLDLIKGYVLYTLGITREEGYSLNDLIKYDHKINCLTEEYVSQFDDILPEEDQTTKSRFKPELIEGLSFDQIYTLAWNSDGMMYIDEHIEEIENTLTLTPEQKKMLDTNLNGSIDSQDYIIAEMLNDYYFKDYFYDGDDAKLITQERMDNFYNNFDFDGNGLNGDIADIRWSEILYKKILEVDDVKDAYYRSKNWDEEYWDWAANQQNRRNFAEQYRQDIESGKKPAPDLNEDGKVDIIDYVAASAAVNSKIIFQYRYKLITDAHIISDKQLERFFEVYDLNDDGVYGDREDLYIMQMYIEKINGWTWFEQEAYRQEFVSQYDDILNEDERTLFYDMKKDLVKGMTAVEKYSLLSCEYDIGYYINIAKENEFNYDMVKQFDLNLNGSLEAEDVVIAYYLNDNYFSDEFEYPEDGKLITDEIKENFYKNFDPDGNGVCGSYGDVAVIENYMEDLLEREYLLEDYREGKLNKDISFRLDELEFLDPESEEDDFYSYYYYYFDDETEDETEDERNGDANVDDAVNLADSVAILQAYINPDKYALSEEGSYNADISNTGDGVTPLDAQKIQKMLLNID